jgi:hypothetical protein
MSKFAMIFSIRIFSSSETLTVMTVDGELLSCFTLRVTGFFSPLFLIVVISIFHRHGIDLPGGKNWPILADINIAHVAATAFA